MSAAPGAGKCGAAGQVDYAARLLDSLGVAGPDAACGNDAAQTHPARAWAASGLLGADAATPAAARAIPVCPAPLAANADRAAAALARLLRQDGMAASLPPGSLWLGARRRAGPDAGRVPRHHCRLLPARDGWLAVNLAREDDIAALPAWLEDERACDPAAWPGLLASRHCADLLARAALLGLAVAGDGERAANPPPWCAVERIAPAPPRAAPLRAPRVLDLSSLWAGPLAAQLLRLGGAQVVKLESSARPDGARQGHAGFYRLLNGGKASVSVDLRQDAGRAALRALIAQADIVIESARPRALLQMGIDARAMIAAHPGLTWLAISGYGRAAGDAGRIAYGDDAAVAAGLSQLMRRAHGRRQLVGDAIADPLTGVHAALAAYALYRQGGGALLSVSLCGVVAAAMGEAWGMSGRALRLRARRWQKIAAAGGPAALPQIPQMPPAADLGADNAQYLGRLAA